MNEFAEKLREVRTHCGLRQLDVAQALGISMLTYQRWEAGTHEPRVSELRRLAILFKVPASELLGDESRIIIQRGSMRLELPDTPEGITLAREKLEEFTAGESSPA